MTIFDYIYDFFINNLFSQSGTFTTLDNISFDIGSFNLGFDEWLAFTLTIITIILIFVFFIKFIIWLFKLFGGLFKW